MEHRNEKERGKKVIMNVIKHWNRLIQNAVGISALGGFQERAGQGPKHADLTYKVTTAW